jgi:hypothetical protein
MYVREGMEREEIALPFRSSHWMMGNMQLRKRKKWDRNQDGLVHVLEHKPISPLLFSVGGEGREKSAREHKHQMENHHLSTEGERDGRRMKEGIKFLKIKQIKKFRPEAIVIHTDGMESKKEEEA